MVTIEPHRARVTIVEQRPGLAAIARPIKTTARRREHQIWRRRMRGDGVNVRINQGFGRTFEVRVAVAAFCESPCFTTIVRAERAADFDCRVRAFAMKGKAAHTSGRVSGKKRPCRSRLRYQDE